MKYKVIFSAGYEDDLESLTKKLRCDILLLYNDNYYQFNFITLERIKGEFSKDKICYLEQNMIILHEVTKKNILESIPELFKWQFFKRCCPLKMELIEKYYYPKDDWAIFEVDIE